MTIDPRALRDAFGAFMTGVTVVTTFDKDGAPKGFTANSFTSVSLDPPLLLVCIAKSSTSLDAFGGSAGFAVNILSEKQKAISNRFASPVADRFAETDWRKGPHGAPILEDVVAWFDCGHHQRIDAGDHVVMIGEIEAFASNGGAGLGYARGGYFAQSDVERAMGAASEGVAVMVSAVARRGDAILVVEEPGGLALPHAPMAPGRGALRSVERLVRELGLEARSSFVYAVLEENRTQHIVYRCEADGGEPIKGRFVTLDRLTPEEVASKPMRAILQRYAQESRLGNFGVHFGEDDE